MCLDRKALIFFILLLFAVVNAYAANDSTDVAGSGIIFQQIDPVDLQPVPGYPESSSGTDMIVSFWDLPAWVQLTYLSIIAIAILGLLKLMPFAFGRLKHALENPKTKDIFYYIMNNPGLTIKQLSEKQSINRGTLKYHLTQLFTNNKIMLIRKGKISQLYHNTLSPEDKESVIASYLRREDRGPSILFTIMDNPGVTNKDLSEKFGVDKSTITDYMKKFTDDGLVEFRQDGRYKRCYMMQDARMIMLRYRPQ